jgi:hypothetical protein
MNTADVPEHDRTNISISSLQLRGIRSPPQTYDGDAGRPYRRSMHEGADVSTTAALRHGCRGDAGRPYRRLIREGADVNTVIVLRGVIVASGVTLGALMAPYPGRGNVPRVRWRDEDMVEVTKSTSMVATLFVVSTGNDLGSRSLVNPSELRKGTSTAIQKT